MSTAPSHQVTQFNSLYSHQFHIILTILKFISVIFEAGGVGDCSRAP